MSTMKANAYLDSAGGNTATINGLVPLGAGASKVTILTTGTSVTFTPNSRTKRIHIRMVGGGGGGGGCSATSATFGGSGSGAAYLEYWFDPSAFPGIYTYTVGAAGAAGAAAAAGGNGGASSFDLAGYTLYCPGGVGGIAGATSTTKYTAGAAVATGGHINLGGDYGQTLSNLILGGSSPLGRGGWLATSNTNGVAGSGYGAGGSSSISTGVAKTGGAGTQGVIIVSEFY